MIYKIKVKFSYNGWVKVQAKDREEARRMLEEGFYAKTFEIGDKMQSSEYFKNWDFESEKKF